MEHGDISNEPVPKILLRFEEIVKREHDGKLNRSGKAFLENMAHLDIQIILITTGSERKAKAFCYKWAIPYTTILAADTVLDLIQVAREQNAIAFWDTDPDILSKVHERAPKNLEVKRWTLKDNSFLE